jgi:Na+/melibiose symporter-like transporter
LDTVAPQGKVFTIGTLRYTMAGIWMLFFWLLWNDIVLMLMEQVPQLTGYIWKNYGATQTDMAKWGAIAGPLTLWINPVFSTWSDRTRTRWGRRRPFLLFAAPPAAVFLALIPFMPDLARWAMHFPAVQRWTGGNLNGAVFPLLTFGTLLFSIFNAIILSIFSYYFWDVVPKPVLGRFQSMTKMAALGAGWVFNYFIFGLAEQHMHAVFIAMAIFFVVVYVATICLVKEGEYPPPEPRKNSDRLTAFFEGAWAYLTDCFGHTRYLWIFATFIIIQVGNQTGTVGMFLRLDQLHLSMSDIGKINANASLAVLFITMAIGFPVGALVDRVGALRLVAPCLLLWAAANFVAFRYVQGYTSLLLCSILITVANFPYTMCVAALTPEVYPKDKLGQFCSASSISQSLVCIGTIILAGMLFDHLGQGFYHYAYLWSTICELIGVLGFLKIYFDWRRERAAKQQMSRGHVN